MIYKCIDLFDIQLSVITKTKTLRISVRTNVFIIPDYPYRVWGPRSSITIIFITSVTMPVMKYKPFSVFVNLIWFECCPSDEFVSNTNNKRNEKWNSRLLPRTNFRKLLLCWNNNLKVQQQLIRIRIINKKFREIYFWWDWFIIIHR